MNRSFRFLFAVPVMVLLLTAVTSCTMQKQLYRPGYHIETVRTGKTKTAIVLHAAVVKRRSLFPAAAI